MESLIEFLQSNPLYIAGFVCLIIFIVMSLIKKAIKLAVVAVILFAGYSYYLNDISAVYQESTERIKLIESKAKELVD